VMEAEHDSSSKGEPSTTAEEALQEVPPPILFENENQVSAMAFHPLQDVLVAGLADGAANLYQYSPQGNTSLFHFAHHKGACHCVAFSSEGKFLFTGGADKSLAAIDLSTGSLLFQKQNAHNHPLESMATCDNILATGDEEGVIKVWDLRQSKQVFAWHEHQDFISDLVLLSTHQTLLAPRSILFEKGWNGSNVREHGR